MQRAMNHFKIGDPHLTLIKNQDCAG